MGSKNRDISSEKPYVLMISEEIWSSGEAYDVAQWLTEYFMKDPAVMRRYRENVELTFGDMPDDGRPAWAVPALARTLVDLDKRWPYSLFFLSRAGKALEAIQLSVGNARVVRSESGKYHLLHDQAKVAEHLSKVWVPALQSACGRAGLGQKEFDESWQSALQYFASGRVGSGR